MCVKHMSKIFYNNWQFNSYIFHYLKFNNFNFQFKYIVSFILHLVWIQHHFTFSVNSASFSNLPDTLTSRNIQKVKKVKIVPLYEVWL